MVFRLLVTVLLTVVTACGGSAPMESSAALYQEADARSGTMAFQHTVHATAKATALPRLLDSLSGACQADTLSGCTVLESSIGSGPGAAASLRLRAQRAGIDRLIALLERDAEVVSRSTSGDDLGAPIADGERRLTMLTAYRDQLEVLRSQAGKDVDALIKVHKELAEVQSQLEMLAGERAELAQRVSTEILHVSIVSTGQTSFWGPVGEALGRFTQHLSQGIAGAITGLAYLLPWLLIGWGLVTGVRALLRRRRARRGG